MHAVARKVNSVFIVGRCVWQLFCLIVVVMAESTESKDYLSIFPTCLRGIGAEDDFSGSPKPG